MYMPWNAPTWLLNEHTSRLRTGLAIAGAGTVIVAFMGDSWPEWLSLIVAGVFIAVGYTMIIVTLNNYQKIVQRLQIEQNLNVMSPNGDFSDGDFANNLGGRIYCSYLACSRFESSGCASTSRRTTSVISSWKWIDQDIVIK